MFRKIILFLLCTSIVLSMIACGQTPALDPAATDFPTEETQNTGTTNITEETIPEDSAYNYVDFVVEVDPDKDPVVLQLSDPQIIDSSQLSAGYLNADMVAFYAKDKVDERCYNYIRETVAATNPDLILITGDLIFGIFDKSGEVWLSFVSFMDSFQIPWAPIFGNHDSGCKKGIDWMCQQLEQAEYCLFKQRDLTGNSNYTVGIKQGDDLKRVFFMLDSNMYADMSEETQANGHSTSTLGFGSDQIDWYKDTATQITTLSPQTKFTFAFHIHIAKFATVFSKYGSVKDKAYFKPVDIDQHPNKVEGDFGYIGEYINTAFDEEGRVWTSIKKLGVDSILVGHRHSNSASAVYNGIRFQFGQKSSTYERTNFQLPDGTIVDVSNGAPPQDAVPLVGGTVMPLSKEDGSIKDPYIYLCKNP